MIIRLFLITVLFVIGALGNTVSLDTSFNGTGYSLHSLADPPARSFGSSMVLQPDGKIVIGGRIVNDDSVFGLIRVHSDGSLDTSFGNNGKVLTTIGNFGSTSRILLQPDGKILLGGITYTDETYYDYTIIRYNTDGSLDTSFNNIGHASQTFNSSSYDEVADMALQSDGKIVLVGRTGQIPGIPNIEFNIGVMRFNSDGSLDTIFNGKGKHIIGTTNLEEAANEVLIQADGKILIGGYLIENSIYKVMLVRLNSDGTLDSSFGIGGMTIRRINPGDNYVTGMALQSDGRIVVGGTGFFAGFTTNGQLDQSFGINGVSAIDGEVNQVKILSNDKILVANKFGANAGVTRLMANGAYDTHFNGGSRNFFLQGNSCIAQSVEIQSDNKIVLGGYCSSSNPNTSKFAIFRFEEKRTKRFLDFNGDSTTDISIYRPSNGQWWYLQFLFDQRVLGQFGLPTDKPVPADFTGDGRTDLAVFRPSTGEWFVSRSDNGSFYGFPWGISEDIPIAADFDGDNIADPSVFRPSTNQWFIQKSTGGIRYETFGLTGDKLVPADYDGDFITDIAIYRPSEGTWWIHKSSDDNIYAVQFGTSTDIPVQGDYTGDNQTDLAFWRPSTSEWFILRSEDYSYYAVPFGLSDDLPTPGNFTGDSRYDIAVFRPSENRWHLLPTGGSYLYKDFGSAGDQILPNLPVP